MKIFTERAFQEELAKRRKEREKEEWFATKMRHLEKEVDELRGQIIRMREEMKGQDD